MKRLIVLLLLFCFACSTTKSSLVSVATPTSNDNVVINCALTGKDITGQGIIVTGNNWTIENCKIHDTSGQGIYVNKNIDGTIIKNNITYANELDCIEVQGTNYVVDNNECYGTLERGPLWPTAPTYPTWIDADGIRAFGGPGKITNNRIHDIVYNDTTNIDPHIDCIQTFKGDGSYVPLHDVMINGNICIEPFSNSSLSAKFMDAEYASNLTITNNITVSSITSLQKFGINISVIGNTWIGNKDDPNSYGFIFTNTIGITVQKNIFEYQQNGIGSIWLEGTSSGLIAGNNCVFAFGEKPARSADPGDIWGLDPLLVNYYPASNSPCLGFGAVPMIVSTATVIPSETPTITSVPTITPSMTQTQTSAPTKSPTGTFTLTATNHPKATNTPKPATKTMTPTDVSSATPMVFSTLECEMSTTTSFVISVCKK